MAYPETVGRTDRTDYGYQQMPSDLALLKDLDDYDVADYDVDPRGWKVVGRDGDEIGKIDDLIVSTASEKAYFAVVDTGGWFQNKRFAIPLERVRFDRNDNKAYAPYVKDQFREAPEYNMARPDYTGYYGYWSGLRTEAVAPERETAFAGEHREREVGLREGEVRVPVTEETAEVRKEAHEAGFVNIRKRVDYETKHISEPVTRTRVVAETREVPAGGAYATEGATTLREGETLRVPIVEEDVTVTKTPRVTREVVLHTEQDTEMVERDVQLRHEEVEVDTEGDVDIEQPTGTGRMRR